MEFLRCWNEKHQAGVCEQGAWQQEKIKITIIQLKSVFCCCHYPILFAYGFSGPNSILLLITADGLTHSGIQMSSRLPSSSASLNSGWRCRVPHVFSRPFIPSALSTLGSAGWMDTGKATDVNFLLCIQILPMCIVFLLASHGLFPPSRCAGSVQGEASPGVLAQTASPVTRPRISGGNCAKMMLCFGQIWWQTKTPCSILLHSILLQWWKTTTCLYWGSGVSRFCLQKHEGHSV